QRGASRKRQGASARPTRRSESRASPLDQTLEQIEMRRDLPAGDRANGFDDGRIHRRGDSERLASIDNVAIDEVDFGRATPLEILETRRLHVPVVLQNPLKPRFHCRIARHAARPSWRNRMPTASAAIGATSARSRATGARIWTHQLTRIREEYLLRELALRNF